MKTSLILVLVFISQHVFSQNTGIYALKADSITGNKTIDFSHFQNKKILIVNSATLDKNFSELFELDKLQKQHSDSLVVVVFPTGDFGSEPGNNNTISTLLQRYNLSIVIAGKVSVKGSKMHAIYYWLTHQSLSGVSDLSVTEPFQKYLIDSSGNLVHVFSSAIRPMSITMINAINE